MFDTHTCHDPVLTALVTILDVIFGRSRVYADLPGRRAALDEWMRTAGASLRHRPDAVVRLPGQGAAGPGSRAYVIDVKTLDPCGHTHVDSHHADRDRLAAHLFEQRRCRRSDYEISDSADLPVGMHLVVFTVSTFGSLGPEAQAFLDELSRRTGGAVPRELREEVSWAASSLAPFARMAVGCAARRGLARSVLDLWSRGHAEDAGDADADEEHAAEAAVDAEAGDEHAADADVDSDVEMDADGPEMADGE